MPYRYGNPRRNFLASVHLTPKPDYFGYATSARPSSVTAAAMRRSRGDDYNLYSASGSGSSRFSHTYGMRTTGPARPSPPRVNYQAERLYADREQETSVPAYSAAAAARDIRQSSWAVRAQERMGGGHQRAASADRAGSVGYMTDRGSSVERVTSSAERWTPGREVGLPPERWKPVQEIRPSRMYLSSHIFSEPMTLIDKPMIERSYRERSSSLGRRMEPMPTISTKRTYY